MDRVLDSVAIGGKIRSFRLEAGFTQERLAERLGITFQQVQKYERGITKVNLSKLQQLAAILNVPVTAFFDGDSHTTYNLSNQEQLLLKRFRGLKQHHRDSLLDLLDGLTSPATKCLKS
jgi:transcriptional regulator with XRE-family HTH domain